MTRSYVPLFSSVCTSERLADLPSDGDRLFYTWLLAACDHWGRITARPRALRARVWPMLDKSVEDTEEALEELVGAGLLAVLEHPSGDRYIQIPDWDGKAGAVRRPYHRAPSDFPLPSDSPPKQKRGEERKGKESTVDGPSSDDPSTIPGSSKSDSTSRRLFRDPPLSDYDLDRPDVRSQWQSYVAFRQRQRFRPWADRTVRMHLKDYAGDPDALVASLEHCEKQEYQGLFRPPSGTHRNGRPTGLDALKSVIDERRTNASHDH